MRYVLFVKLLYDIYTYKIYYRTPSEFKQKKDLIKDAIQLTIAVNRMKRHFIWGTINAILFSMLTYDL